MDYFDAKWNGINFEMGIEFDEDADMPHWTDVDFASDCGDIGSGKELEQIGLHHFTKETEELIRQSAYEQYQEKAKRDYESEGCDAYHRMKDDANA